VCLCKPIVDGGWKIPAGRGAPIARDQIFVYFQSFVNESIVLSFHPPTCIAHTDAILLHDY